MQREDVWPQDLEKVRDQPAILKSIQDTLTKIFDTCGDDIQTFLKEKSQNFYGEYLRKARENIKFDDIEAEMHNLKIK